MNHGVGISGLGATVTIASRLMATLPQDEEMNSRVQILPCLNNHNSLFLNFVQLYRAAMNMVEQVSLWYDGESFGYIHKSGIAGS